MSGLTLGVVGTSRKENEHRIPIHPDHFDRIPEILRSRVRFENGYGEVWGISDHHLGKQFGGTASRSEILAESGVVLLPKPLLQDLGEIREGGILWGWPHCVQQAPVTQLAIDRRLTLIAWEAMHVWKKGETGEMHLFYRNNEMAGYCAVLHAMELAGVDGYYGPRREAVVLSLGSVSRGAIAALRGRGVEDVAVYTQRPGWAVHDRVPGCRYGQMVRAGDTVEVVEDNGLRRPLVQVLARADIIVNGILQDTDSPLMFMREGDEKLLKPGSLIVDGSCDDAMGFPFARPTTFEAPTFRAGNAVYYAVDHTPTYLWRSASWEISHVVTAYVETVLGGGDAWDDNETIRRAIEIRDGVVQNPKILSYQKRSPEHPHPRLSD